MKKIMSLFIKLNLLLNIYFINKIIISLKKNTIPIYFIYYMFFLNIYLKII